MKKLITCHSVTFEELPFLTAGECTFLLRSKSQETNVLDKLNIHADAVTSLFAHLTLATLKGETLGFTCQSKVNILYVASESERADFYELINYYCETDELIDSAKSHISFIEQLDFINRNGEIAKLKTKPDFIFVNSLDDLRGQEEENYNNLFDFAEANKIGILLGCDMDFGFGESAYYDYYNTYVLTIRNVAQSAVFTINAQGEKENLRLVYKVLDNGAFTTFHPGYIPNNDILRSIFQTFLSHSKWNVRKQEYEDVATPKYKNELIRLLMTTNVTNCAQSAGGAEHIIKVAEMQGIIKRTEDDELIATCNTKQAIKNHKCKKCHFAYILA